MTIRFRWTRPLTFHSGGIYLRRRAARGHLPLEIAAVRFVAYDSCPAFIIVAGPSGSLQRCPRDELFLQPAAAPAVGNLLNERQEDSLLNPARFSPILG